MKRLVVAAIDLYVMDVEGVGCFQHAPRPRVEELIAYEADRERLAKVALGARLPDRRGQGVLAMRRIERAQELGRRTTRCIPSNRAGMSPAELAQPAGSHPDPKVPGATGKWATSNPTVVVLFGEEVGKAMTFCAKDPWGFPQAVSTGKTGEERALEVLRGELGDAVTMHAEPSESPHTSAPGASAGEAPGSTLVGERYHVLPSLINEAEVVVGVVPTERMGSLPQGKGRTLQGLKWRPVVEAQGAKAPNFITISGEGWGFLGVLEALEHEEDEWILRPIVLWCRSFA